MNAPWLFAEAYKYRRLHEAFSVSRYWKDYDVFYRQKVPRSPPFQLIHALISVMDQCDTFSRSSEAVFELSMRFADPFKLDKHTEAERPEAERLMFLELTQGLSVFSRLEGLLFISYSLPLGQFD
jgi:hypothetical protein